MSAAWPGPPGSPAGGLRAWLAAVALGLGALLAAASSAAAMIEPAEASLLVASDRAPPAADRPWERVALPDVASLTRPQAHQAVSWYRVGFELPGEGTGNQPWALYLPYLYHGGQVWLNGALVAHLPDNTSAMHVRWARPHLIALPPPLLRPGTNTLMVRASAPPARSSIYMPRLTIGPEAELTPVYGWRLFWVSTTPQITAAVCLLVAVFALFIWWRRRSEVVYGLFGLAAALWGIRTLTFVIEVVPIDLWHRWRIAYLGATGGFILVMALISMRMGNIRHKGVERSLIAYWALGPLFLLAGGAGVEPLVNRYWIAGFMPIGLFIVALSCWAVWRQRTWISALMPAAMLLAVAAGIHDWFVNWSVGGAERLLGEWFGHRIFLLHYGADFFLVVMGMLLTARFLQALSGLENMNRTLETRVEDRERELSENYRRLAALERDHAASQERQLIMRDLHDGLGSQLFTSLSRVERDDMSSRQIADALRACIADMRLALDTLTPQDSDFRSALGDFLFRWQGELEAAGVHSAWSIDIPDDAPRVSPHALLQVLRIAQEALTNVLKHARATELQLRLKQTAEGLSLEVHDNGNGSPATGTTAGRGIGNMQARARQLGGELEVRHGPDGTRIALYVPMDGVAA